MDPRVDHYTFLGVPRSAPPDQIAVAWDRIQRQADAMERRSPAQAQAIRDRLQAVRDDLLSGAARRQAYNEWLLSAGEPAPEEPTVVQPLRPPPYEAAPPPQYEAGQQYTGVLPEAGGTTVASSDRSRPWLLPVIAVLALLVGAGVAFAAGHLLSGSSKTAAVATATSAPTSTTEPQPSPTPAPRTSPTSAPGLAPTSAPPTSAPPTSPPATSAQPTVAPANDPTALDPATVKARGFTPIEPHAQTGDGSGGTLYAWIGTCTGSADGYCQKVFFFDGTRYLGTDTLTDSPAIMSIAATGPATIAVKYANYGPNDAFCCPSGQPVTITYHWTGSRLVPSGTPPGHRP